MLWQFEASQVWQNSEDNGYQWQYACLNLPTSKSGRIMFKALSERGYSSVMAIDDIAVSNGPCQSKWIYIFSH